MWFFIACFSCFWGVTLRVILSSHIRCVYPSSVFPSGMFPAFLLVITAQFSRRECSAVCVLMSLLIHCSCLSHICTKLSCRNTLGTWFFFFLGKSFALIPSFPWWFLMHGIKYVEKCTMKVCFVSLVVLITACCVCVSGLRTIRQHCRLQPGLTGLPVL